MEKIDFKKRKRDAFPFLPGLDKPVAPTGRFTG
jgi:hypothetical protein